MRLFWVACLCWGCGDGDGPAMPDGNVSVDGPPPDAVVVDAVDRPDSAPIADGGQGNVTCPDVCSCEMGQNCDFDCGSSGCSMAECVGGTCTADCEGGGCALDCDLMGVCEYDCPGGGCVFDCDAASSCALSCTGGGCDVTCDDGSTCALDCAGAPNACTIQCQHGATATCTGNCSPTSC